MSSLDPSTFFHKYSQEVSRVITALDPKEVSSVLDLLAQAHRKATQVFIIGNGGSAATASHWANDLTWGLIRAKLPPIRAIALTDNVPVITAIANDASYDEIFSRQLDVLANKGDLLIAISGSGNSPNIVRAVDLARSRGLLTIGILGMGGGRLATLTDARITVDSTDYGPIEDVHMMLDHLTLAYLKQAQLA
jgi:D-sedoheptulose 7-phosphate isomerase